METRYTQDGLETLFRQGVAQSPEPVLTSLRQAGSYSQSDSEELHRIDIVMRIASLEKAIEQQKSFFKISTVFLNTLGSNLWELVRPLAVAIEQRAAEDFVACLYDGDLYGYGDSVPESLEDLKSVIVNQYEYLLGCQKEKILSASLDNQLLFLSKLLVTRNA
jgi:hypothetical protein